MAGRILEEVWVLIELVPESRRRKCPAEVLLTDYPVLV
jgi:hypothetical protein